MYVLLPVHDFNALSRRLLVDFCEAEPPPVRRLGRSFGPGMVSKVH